MVIVGAVVATRRLLLLAAAIPIWPVPCAVMVRVPEPERVRLAAVTATWELAIAR